MENVLYVVNPLLVSKKSNKFRLNLDLGNLNMHVYRDKVKFEDWDDIRLFRKWVFYVQVWYQVGLRPLRY